MNSVTYNSRIYTHEELALLSVGLCLEKKAVRPVVLDLSELGAFTNYFAIVSAANSRQVYAIAEDVRVFFREHFNLTPMSVDGLDSGTWALLDFGFMFVHVFQEPTREVYQLEKLWSKGRLIDVTHERLEDLLSPFKKQKPADTEE